MKRVKTQLKMYLGIVLDIIVKAKCSGFNTCKAFVSCMPLHKVMRRESELSEQPLYLTVSSHVFSAFETFWQQRDKNTKGERNRQFSFG